MLIDITRYRPRHLIKSIGFALFFGLVGCGTQVEEIDETNADALVAQFVAGESKLTCRTRCSGRWGGNRREMFKMYELCDRYRDEACSALAERVIRIGYNTDLAWFYLGVAAEGLDLKDSAKRYYDLGLRNSKKCDGSLFDLCDGLNIPKEIERRLANL